MDVVTMQCAFRFFFNKAITFLHSWSIVLGTAKRITCYNSISLTPFFSDSVFKVFAGFIITNLFDKMFMS